MDAPGDAAPEPLRLTGSTVAWPRRLLLRGLGFVYAVAFFILLRQLRPLFGQDGLTPVPLYLDRVAQALGGRWEGFVRLPAVFWLDASDGAMMAAAAVGLALSLAVLAGVENAVVMALLWALYMSFVHVGQLWLSYGWETLLLEAGFLAIFLCRLGGGRNESPPAGSTVVIWLFRWLAFRLMFGAGLIKLRGDACWRELTCLQWHYETQPNPHPLSWLLHQLPDGVHTLGVGFNHLVELVVPFTLFAPRPVRAVGAALLITFQVVLIGSGNLAFVNWLTLVICCAALDDRIVDGLLARLRRAQSATSPSSSPPSRPRLVVVGVLAVVVGVLSLDPVANMLSRDQVMNTSFDRLHLVNSYGMFGSVQDSRVEVVIQGREEGGPWLDYELPCKPGRVDRAPCIITPYHLRLDWQLWFVQFSPRIERHPWLVHLVWKLLDGDPLVRRLFAHDPFDGGAPDQVRLVLYRYHFTTWGQPGWWTREERGELVRPVTLDDPALVGFVEAQGWK